MSGAKTTIIPPRRHLAWIPWNVDARGAAVVIESAALAEVRGIASRSWSRVHFGHTISVTIRLRWYCWLGLGIVHFIAWRRAKRAAVHVRPPAYQARVRVL